MSEYTYSSTQVRPRVRVAVAVACYGVEYVSPQHAMQHRYTGTRPERVYSVLEYVHVSMGAWVHGCMLLPGYDGTRAVLEYR